MTQKLKNSWDEDGYLIFFNEMNDVKGRWNLTKESFHRILDIFELKEKETKYDFFRFVIYFIMSKTVFEKFHVFVNLLNEEKKKKTYKPYFEGQGFLTFSKSELILHFWNTKLEKFKVNFFIDESVNIITFFINFSIIVEFIYWNFIEYLLLMFKSEVFLQEFSFVKKTKNLKINVNRYDRMVQAVSKFLETPFLTLTAEEFDEIQKNITLKSNFNAEWLEAISEDLKSFIAETLANVYIRSFIQGSMSPVGVKQMNHFFLQKGILQHVGIPWEDKDYLLFLWDKMLTKKPSEYYKTKYPDRIDYDRFQEKSEYMFPGETLEFIKYVDTADLQFSFVEVNQSKLDEWRFFLNRVSGIEKNNLNLIFNFKLNDSFDEHLSQFIAHNQHPEILADLILENMDELPMLSIRHLPDFINWERYDEVFDEFD